MATQTAPAAAPQDELASQIRVAVPERSLRSDLRAVSIVWRREMIRFRRDRLRAVTSLIQPLLFLLVLGTGLSSLAGRSLPSGVNFKTFIFPGVLAMSVLFTAVFSAASIVWDREFGFLREMLVAPVSRAAIVVGKCLGGATIATFQGIVMLALAGLAGVPYNPVLFAHPDRRAAAAVVHHHRVRGDDGGPDHPVPGVHGADPDAGHAAVLPVRRAVPAERAARLAERADPDRPADLRGRPDAARGVLAPQPEPAVRLPAVAQHHLAGLAGAGHGCRWPSSRSWAWACWAWPSPSSARRE